jgi:hypothetical protein
MTLQNLTESQRRKGLPHSILLAARLLGGARACSDLRIRSSSPFLVLMGSLMSWRFVGLVGPSQAHTSPGRALGGEERPPTSWR